MSTCWIAVWHTGCSFYHKLWGIKIWGWIWCRKMATDITVTISTFLGYRILSWQTVVSGCLTLQFFIFRICLFASILFIILTDCSLAMAIDALTVTLKEKMGCVCFFSSVCQSVVCSLDSKVKQTVWPSSLTDSSLVPSGLRLSPNTSVTPTWRRTL